jgi:hypothetical protein
MPNNHATTPAALEWINAQRTRCHRPPFTALPPGIGGCRTHSSRRSVAGHATDGLDAGERGQAEAWPAELVRFLIEFDPDLAA